MNVVYLLLGSNLDKRLESIQEAIKGVSLKIGRITNQSSIYESDPWGFFANERFLNQVVKVETILSAPEVLEEILKIETELGRQRNFSREYASRIIDIDILFFNDEIISGDSLTVPHPRIPERMFTLIPLSEMNPYMIHPGLKKTIRELLDECQDKLDVYPYQVVNN